LYSFKPVLPLAQLKIAIILWCEKYTLAPSGQELDLPSIVKRADWLAPISPPYEKPRDIALDKPMLGFFQANLAHIKTQYESRSRDTDALRQLVGPVVVGDSFDAIFDAFCKHRCSIFCTLTQTS
jgi:hypothetical protein